MVIAGKIRSNAPQLASYLLATGKNERITIFDVDGQDNADATRLKEMLYSMQLNSELTRSRNSVYHAYINPNPDDTTDRAMTMEEWQKSVEILTRQLGYEDQRRVVVLHEKSGNRTHAHIVYERYNHERGTMATYQHNFKAHDAARAEMEAELNHKPTPQKNANRDRHQQALTAIWQRTATAKDFIHEAGANGYKIAKGTDRPFRVVDAEGVSFDLLRKLDGVKTADVRQRFTDTELIPEKEAIREMQERKREQRHTNTKGVDSKVLQQEKPVMERQEAEITADTTIKPSAETEREELRRKFLEQMKDVQQRNRSIIQEITLSFLIGLQVCSSLTRDAAHWRGITKQQYFSCWRSNTVREQPKPQEKKLVNF